MLKAQRRHRGPSSWDERGRPPGGQSACRKLSGETLALPTVLGWGVFIYSLRCRSWAGAGVSRVSQGREELGIGTGFLLIIGSRMRAWIVFSLLPLPPEEIPRVPLFSALQVSRLWGTAPTGNQEPWTVQITGNASPPPRLQGFCAERAQTTQAGLLSE